MGLERHSEPSSNLQSNKAGTDPELTEHSDPLRAHHRLKQKRQRRIQEVKMVLLAIDSYTLSVFIVPAMGLA